MAFVDMNNLRLRSSLLGLMHLLRPPFRLAQMVIPILWEFWGFLTGAFEGHKDCIKEVIEL